MTKEERLRVRRVVAEAVTGLTPETTASAAARLSRVVLPDPKAQPNRSGLRTTRDVIQEAAATLCRRVRNRSKLEALLDEMWRSSAAEMQAAVAYASVSILAAEDEEGEAVSVERVRRSVTETASSGVAEAFADTVSREVEMGRGDCWMRAVAAWADDGDPRLRRFGPDVYASLFGRGASPEKLFDALQLARKLIADEDDAVRGSVRNLLFTAVRKHAPAVGRFLKRFDGDDRPEVTSLVEEVTKRLERDGDRLALEL